MLPLDGRLSQALPRTVRRRPRRRVPNFAHPVSGPKANATHSVTSRNFTAHPDRDENTPYSVTCQDFTARSEREENAPYSAVPRRHRGRPSGPRRELPQGTHWGARVCHRHAQPPNANPPCPSRPRRRSSLAALSPSSRLLPTLRVAFRRPSDGSHSHGLRPRVGQPSRRTARRGGRRTGPPEIVSRWLTLSVGGRGRRMAGCHSTQNQHGSRRTTGAQACNN